MINEKRTKFGEKKEKKKLSILESETKQVQ